MSPQENKQSAQAAYAAFIAGDADGAMRKIDDSIRWRTRGNNALTGTRTGKSAVGELWGALVAAGFRTQPHHFVADGDTVVVLTTTELGGESEETVDVLTYSDAGTLIGFDTFGGAAIMDRVFSKERGFSKQR